MSNDRLCNHSDDQNIRRRFRQLGFASLIHSLRLQPTPPVFPGTGFLDVRMLSSTLRRAARPPAVPIPGFSLSSSQALAASSVRHRSYSSSSSKPSDGSRKVDASSQTPAKASRRKGKDGNGRNGSSKPNQNAAFSNLPSVPSTQHRQPHGMHI